MDNERSINATREGFEKSFSEAEFYNKQTRDEKHLNDIIGFLGIKSGMKILDLGTGSGYLSFPIAKMYPEAEIKGLDILEKTLEANRERARRDNISNIRFVSYNGIDFPFADEEYDMIITRYSLHHFPEIEKSISEARRVLKPHGTLFISDPAPNDCDISRFVDEYMQMKKDGHIRFYTFDEWNMICSRHSFEYQKSFESSIRFPRKREECTEFEDTISRHDNIIIDSYDIDIRQNEIYITEKVNNILFKAI